MVGPKSLLFWKTKLWKSNLFIYLKSMNNEVEFHKKRNPLSRIWGSEGWDLRCREPGREIHCLEDCRSCMVISIWVEEDGVDDIVAREVERQDKVTTFHPYTLFLSESFVLSQDEKDTPHSSLSLTNKIKYQQRAGLGLNNQTSRKGEKLFWMWKHHIWGEY